MPTDIEVLNEKNTTRLNQFVIEAGRNATTEHTKFCLGVWKMYQLKPWINGAFRVDDMEIESWFEWRKYIAGKSKGHYSANTINYVAQRIDWLVNQKVGWPEIITAIAYYPVAIDDLRYGDKIDTPIPELLANMAELPDPSEARKMVAKEQGRRYFIVIDSDVEDGVFSAEVQEYLGDELADQFSVKISNWGKLKDSQKNWIETKVLRIKGLKD